MIIILIIVSGIDPQPGVSENDSHSHSGSFPAWPSGVIFLFFVNYERFVIDENFACFP